MSGSGVAASPSVTVSSDRRRLPLPRLHLVTDEEIVRAPGFTGVATNLMRAYAADIALHLRGRGLSGRELYEVAVTCVATANETGALVVINDRVDVALCSGAPAAQLPGHSLDIATVRRVAGRELVIGCSVHSRGEAAVAIDGGADFLLAGTVFTTPSHPETEGSGTAWLGGLAALGRPVVAIGGIDAENAGTVVHAGAHGVAVVRAVWSAEDPVEAAARLLEAIAGPAEPRSRSH